MYATVRFQFLPLANTKDICLFIVVNLFCGFFVFFLFFFCWIDPANLDFENIVGNHCENKNHPFTLCKTTSIFTAVQSNVLRHKYPLLKTVSNIVSRFYHVHVILIQTFSNVASILTPTRCFPLKRKTNVL